MTATGRGELCHRACCSLQGERGAAPWSSCTCGRGDERTSGGGPGVLTRRRSGGESRDGDGGLEPPRREVAQGSRTIEGRPSGR